MKKVLLLLLTALTLSLNAQISSKYKSFTREKKGEYTLSFSNDGCVLKRGNDSLVAFDSVTIWNGLDTTLQMYYTFDTICDSSDFHQVYYNNLALDSIIEFYSVGLSYSCQEVHNILTDNYWCRWDVPYPNNFFIDPIDTTEIDTLVGINDVKKSNVEYSILNGNLDCECDAFDMLGNKVHVLARNQVYILKFESEFKKVIWQ